MLFLIFQLAADRYAIDAADVVEVLPLVNSKRIPHTPAGVAGIFDYHGAPVPLIDLAELTLGTPSQKWMSTRIVLINYRQRSGEAQLLGFLAEHATETLRRPEEDFKDSGVTVPGAPYLGPVLIDASGIIQRIDIRKLLPEAICSHLYGEPVGSRNGTCRV
jgi:chemotaxis-related protein WspB